MTVLAVKIKCSDVFYRNKNKFQNSIFGFHSRVISLSQLSERS